MDEHGTGENTKMDKRGTGEILRENVESSYEIIQRKENDTEDDNQIYEYSIPMDSTRSSISPPPTLSPIPDVQVLTFDVSLMIF
uniref:Uncharacterized protein n=1 Tax=Panagrolaimus davidi TaxID=227884 RepID=A0A914QWC1_9BILA